MPRDFWGYSSGYSKQKDAKHRFEISLNDKLYKLVSEDAEAKSVSKARLIAEILEKHYEREQ